MSHRRVWRGSYSFEVEEGAGPVPAASENKAARCRLGAAR
jgi:hypothetical protein